MATLLDGLNAIRVTVEPFQIEEVVPDYDTLLYTRVQLFRHGEALTSEVITTTLRDLSRLRDELLAVASGDSHGLQWSNLDNNCLITIQNRLPRGYHLDDGEAGMLIALGRPIDLLTTYLFVVHLTDLAGFSEQLSADQQQALRALP